MGKEIIIVNQIDNGKSISHPIREGWSFCQQEYLLHKGVIYKYGDILPCGETFDDRLTTERIYRGL